MSPTFDREIRSDPLALDEMLPALARFLEQNAVEGSVVYVVQLAVEELLLNVMKHAYRGETGRPISLHIEASRNEAIIEVEDNAEPFDPRTSPEPDFDGMLLGDKAGGLGVHLVRSLSATLEYERRGDRNCVRVRVRPLPGQPAS